MVIEAIALSQPAAAASRPLTVAVVGATGLVGTTMMTVLGERGFPVGELRPLASRASGRAITFGGRDWPVLEATPESFEGVDIALFSAGGDVSRVLAPEAAARGAVVIDNSAQWRMEPGVPLVVSQVNPEDAAAHEGIIANPNCSTMQLVPLLMALRDTVGLERVIVDTYQSVSGTGAEAVAELETQVRAWAAGDPIVSSVYPHQIAFNVLPEIDVFRDDGYSKEEWKVLPESRKILHMPELRVSCTAVRVPVVAAHSEAVHVETRIPSAPIVLGSCSRPCRVSWSWMTRVRTAIRWPSTRPAVTTSSWAGSVPIPPRMTAAGSPSGWSRTISARALRPTRSRSPRSCWSAGGWNRHRGEPRRRLDAWSGNGSCPGRPRATDQVSVIPTERTNALAAIATEVRGCTRCRLSTGRTNAVPGEGHPDTEVVFVGEGPGQNEDQQGRPFVGAAGGLLTELMGSIGWQRDHVFITNVVKCRPPGNRDPEPDEIAACAPLLRRQLEVLDPALVVTLGRYSLHTFMPGARIGQVHGTMRPVDASTGARDALAYAMYHPAAAFRQMALKETMREDMARVPAALLEARAGRASRPPNRSPRRVRPNRRISPSPRPRSPRPST